MKSKKAWKQQLYKTYPEHQAKAFERENELLGQWLAQQYKKHRSKAIKQGIAAAKARKQCT